MNVMNLLIVGHLNMDHFASFGSGFYPQVAVVGNIAFRPWIVLKNGGTLVP
jgi:hypothetical protein